MTETAFGALLIILAGAVARRYGVISREDGPLLVRVVINLALPPLIFLILVRADLHASLLLVPVAGFAIHFILLGHRGRLRAALGDGAPARRGDDRRHGRGQHRLLRPAADRGVGQRLLAAGGRDVRRARAPAIDHLDLDRRDRRVLRPPPRRAPRPPLADGLLAFVRLPPNWALAAGLAVNLAGIDLPAIVERPFEILGAATLPLTMLYAGLMIEFRGLRRIWARGDLRRVVRLGIATLIGVAVAEALRFRDDVFNTVVIMAAMPTAMMSLVIGARSGLRSDVLAGAVVVTTLLSTLTLPAWRAVLL